MLLLINGSLHLYMRYRPVTARWQLIVSGLLLSLCLSDAVRALPSDLAIAQLYHTQWTIHDGAPAGIDCLAQTRDGYIWIAAGGRLYRFDGVAFEQIQRVGQSALPGGKIFRVWASPEGGLWVSYLYGGASFINEGRIESYFEREGLPPNSIVDFGRDRSGGMWAATTRGLMRLEGGRWTYASDTWGLPKIYATNISLDRDGTLWVLSDEAIFFLRAGSRRFEEGMRMHAGRGRPYFVSSPDGATWVVQSRFGLMPLRTPARGKPIEQNWDTRGFDGQREFLVSLFDRDSSLWLPSPDGVVRVPFAHGRRSGAAASADPDESQERIALTGERTIWMLEDREGNIWIGTNGGLDKFRASALAKVTLPHASSWPVLAAGNDGEIWVSAGGRLHRFVKGVETEVVQGPGVVLESMYVDRAGTLWIGFGKSIFHWKDGKWIEWHLPAGAGALGGGAQAVTSEPGGALWVSVLRAGVYRVVDNHWTLWGGHADLPRETATTLVFDSKGRLWLGYIDGRVAILDGGRVTIYGASDGLNAGVVQAMLIRGPHAWIGGERGLSWFDGKRFHPVRPASPGQFEGVNGILETSQGDLWLNTDEGAVHICADEVRKGVADPGHAVQFRQLNYLDGMPGAPTDIRPSPTIAQSGDGRIWFMSTNGVVWLDPARLTRNSVVPGVYIRSITADGTRYAPGADAASPLQLPVHPHTVQIDYTALSLAIPERVRFRYRLEGTDIGWQDAGTRREAFFTELAPGRYRFHVVASNDAGLWNTTGATMDFVVPPTFFQSREWIVLCVALASAALWLLFLFRIRQVKTQLHWRNEERLLERARIARELHDTFLQGVQGLVLRFQSAAERIPESEPARQLMEDALDRADRVLAEGRDKVSGIRASIGSDLTQSLRMMGEELARDYAVAFDVQVEGAPCALHPLVHEEAYRIGTEALANAFLHARASRIAVCVDFNCLSLGIVVTDDGTGFDESTARKAGHWGLHGMRERAARIRGRLVVRSRPGAGTVVELRVSGRFAYKNAPASCWTRLLRPRWPGTEDAT